MTLRYLLGTGVVSSPVSKVPNPEIVRRLDAYSHESPIAAPVWHELRYGGSRPPKGKRRTALERCLTDVVMASLSILPHDGVAATWHGDERARLEALGRPRPYADAQIAAGAHANGLVPATVNPKDFVGFNDLDVEGWSKPD